MKVIFLFFGIIYCLINFFWFVLFLPNRKINISDKFKRLFLRLVDTICYGFDMKNYELNLQIIAPER